MESHAEAQDLPRSNSSAFRGMQRMNSEYSLLLVSPLNMNYLEWCRPRLYQVSNSSALGWLKVRDVAARDCQSRSQGLSGAYQVPYTKPLPLASLVVLERDSGKVQVIAKVPHGFLFWKSEILALYMEWQLRSE